MVVYGLKTKSQMNGIYSWRIFFTERDEAIKIQNKENDGRADKGRGGCHVYKTTTEKLDEENEKYIIYNLAKEFDAELKEIQNSDL